MKSIILFTGILLLPFVSACSSRSITAVPSAAKPKEIKVRNDAEIAYVGKAVDDPKKLPRMVEDAFFTLDGPTPVGEIGELTISVDQKTTIGFTKEILFALQAVGHKVAIVSDDKKIVAPPLGVLATDYPEHLVSIKLLADSSGMLEAAELTLGSEKAVKLIIDKKNGTEGLIQQTGHKVKEWLANAKSKNTAIEFCVPAKLPMHDLVMACSSLNVIAEKNESNVEVWPFGYPRETPLNKGIQFDFDPSGSKTNSTPAPVDPLKKRETKSKSGFKLD